MTLRPDLLLVIVLLPLPGLAQLFHYQADVEPVRQTGYQRIVLPPDVVGRLNRNLTDLRLFDTEEHETPYVLTRQAPRRQLLPVPFKIVSQTIQRRQTTLILRKNVRPTLHGITLYVGNTDVAKPAQLSGSNDAHQWYALRDNIRLQPATTQTVAAVRIEVPASDYTYYRLVISDSLSAPLSIRRVTYDSAAVQQGAYTRIDNILFDQRDSSDRKTYLRIHRADPARFARLELRIDSEDPYFRQAVVNIFQQSRDRHGRALRYVAPMQPFGLRHDVPARLDLTNDLISRDVHVAIDNLDSPPLRIAGVQAWQVSTYLTARLTAGKQYVLRFSATDAAAPQYDLAFFRPASDSLATPVGLTNIRPVKGVATGDVGGLIIPRWLIWAALGAVLLVVSGLTYRMLTDIDKRT